MLPSALSHGSPASASPVFPHGASFPVTSEKKAIDLYHEKLPAILQRGFASIKEDPDFQELIACNIKTLKGNILKAFCAIMHEMTTVAITPYSFGEYRNQVLSLLQKSDCAIPYELLNDFVPPPFQFSKIDLLQHILKHPRLSMYQMECFVHGSVLYSSIHHAEPPQHNDVDILLKVALRTKQHDTDFTKSFQHAVFEFLFPLYIQSIFASLKKLFGKAGFPLSPDTFIAKWRMGNIAEWRMGKNFGDPEIAKLFFQKFALKNSKDPYGKLCTLGCNKRAQKAFVCNPGTDTEIKIYFKDLKELPHITRAEEVVVPITSALLENRSLQSANLAFIHLAENDGKEHLKEVNLALSDIGARWSVLTNPRACVFPKILLRLTLGRFLEQPTLQKLFSIFSAQENKEERNSFFTCVEYFSQHNAYSDNLEFLFFIWNYYLLTKQNDPNSQEVKNCLTKIKEILNIAYDSSKDQEMMTAISALAHCLANESDEPYKWIVVKEKYYGCYLEETKQKAFDNWFAIEGSRRSAWINDFVKAFDLEKTHLFSIRKQQVLHSPIPVHPQTALLCMSQEELTAYLPTCQSQAIRDEVTALLLTCERTSPLPSENTATVAASESNSSPQVVHNAPSKEPSEEKRLKEWESRINKACALHNYTLAIDKFHAMITKEEGLRDKFLPICMKIYDQYLAWIKIHEEQEELFLHFNERFATTKQMLKIELKSADKSIQTLKLAIFFLQSSTLNEAVHTYLDTLIRSQLKPSQKEHYDALCLESVEVDCRNNHLEKACFFVQKMTSDDVFIQCLFPLMQELVASLSPENENSEKMRALLLYPTLIDSIWKRGETFIVKCLQSPIRDAFAVLASVSCQTQAQLDILLKYYFIPTVKSNEERCKEYLDMVFDMFSKEEGFDDEDILIHLRQFLIHGPSQKTFDALLATKMRQLNLLNKRGAHSKSLQYFDRCAAILAKAGKVISNEEATKGVMEVNLSARLLKEEWEADYREAIAALEPLLNVENGGLVRKWFKQLQESIQAKSTLTILAPYPSEESIFDTLQQLHPDREFDKKIQCVSDIAQYLMPRKVHEGLMRNIYQSLVKTAALNGLNIEAILTPELIAEIFLFEVDEWANFYKKLIQLLTQTIQYDVNPQQILNCYLPTLLAALNGFTTLSHTQSMCNCKESIIANRNAALLDLIQLLVFITYANENLSQPLIFTPHDPLLKVILTFNLFTKHVASDFLSSLMSCIWNKNQGPVESNMIDGVLKHSHKDALTLCSALHQGLGFMHACLQTQKDFNPNDICNALCLTFSEIGRAAFAGIETTETLEGRLKALCLKIIEKRDEPIGNLEVFIDFFTQLREISQNGSFQGEIPQIDEILTLCRSFSF